MALLLFNNWYQQNFPALNHPDPQSPSKKKKKTRKKVSSLKQQEIHIENIPHIARKAN